MRSKPAGPAVATILLCLCGTTSVTAQSSPTVEATRVLSPLTVLPGFPHDPNSPVTAVTMDLARYHQLKNVDRVTITSFPLDATTSRACPPAR